MNLRGMRPADDLVLEDEPTAGRQRLQLQLHVRVLAVTAGLADQAILRVDGPGDRLAVSHLRRAHVGGHLELAHAGGRPAPPGAARPCRRWSFRPVLGSVATWNVGSSSASRCRPSVNLSSSAFDFGSMDSFDHRRREDDLFQDDRSVLAVQRLARGDLLEAQHRADVARFDVIDLFAVVGVHAHQPADAFPRPPVRVVHRVAAPDRRPNRRGNRPTGPRTDRC